MVRLSASFALIALMAAGSAIAHPHGLSRAELARSNEFQTVARRSLADCQSKLRARGGLVERSTARRKAFAEKARKARGLDTNRHFFRKRDLDTILSSSHLSDATGLTADSDPFDGNSSCVLGSEVTQGPYYVDGELIRSNITDDQEGIPLYADIELIDVNTCEPVSGLYMDFWHANATGVYSGVVASGNGVGTEDASNINTTFLRGIQQTSDEGYAQFIGIFPGHYTSRATHIHILVRQTDGTLNDNDTYTGSTVSHVGQVFFDQDLINQVEEMSPYSTNTQELTTNEDDSILSEEASDIDPVMEYVLLGDDISDGILAWSSLGIDTSASYTVSPAATLTDNGGVANENSEFSGGEGGVAPSDGPFPSDGASPSGGAIPSGGTIPSDGAFPSDGLSPSGDASLTNDVVATNGGIPTDSAHPLNGANPNGASPTNVASPTNGANLTNAVSPTSGTSLTIGGAAPTNSAFPTNGAVQTNSAFPANGAAGGDDGISPSAVPSAVMSQQDC